MATVSGVKHVERRVATEDELEVALERILSVPGIYDGDEIIRVLRSPHYGFEFETDGQLKCYGIISKILQGDQCLELALIVEHARTKLVIISHRSD